MIQPEWIEPLEASVNGGPGDHWYAWLQLGVLYFANGEHEKAKRAFETSRERRDNAWALRNLGALHTINGDRAAAAEALLGAASLLKQRHIAVECGNALVAAGMYGEFVGFERCLPDELRGHGRIKVLNIEALIRLGELNAARAIFDGDLTVNDVREGELLLSDLWALLHRKMIAAETGADEAGLSDDEVFAKYPLPENIDFRMSGGKS